MSIDIVNFNNEIIKTFQPEKMSIKMPEKFGRSEYIIKIVLENKYPDVIVDEINPNTIKIMTYDEFKIFGRETKKAYKQNKKKKKYKKFKNKMMILLMRMIRQILILLILMVMY